MVQINANRDGFFFGRERSRMLARCRQYSSSVHVHGQSTCTPKIGQFNVFNVFTTHSGVHIRQRLAWRLAATQKTRIAGKVGGGRIKQAGEGLAGGLGVQGMCGRHSKDQCATAELGGVERVTEVDAA